MSLNSTEDEPTEFFQKMSEDISDSMDFEGLLEVEFGSMEGSNLCVEGEGREMCEKKENNNLDYRTQ